MPSGAALRALIRMLATGIVAATIGVIATAAPAHAQQFTQRLYAGPAPGSETWTQPERVQRGPQGESVTNVRDPEVRAYLPDPSKADGAAVVLLPGGALRMLGMGSDTQETIARLNEWGVAVIVLKYRTLQIDPAAARPQGPPPGGALPFPKLEIRNANANPSPGDAALDTVLRLAVMDGQEALRLVRRHASEWHIDPKRVGMMGTSAGGGVAIGTLMARAPGAMPDFIISIFGPSLQDVSVPADAPPLFIVTEANHGPVTDGLLALFSMWKAAGKSAELHVFEVPNFSMRVSLWGERAFDWMKEQKLLGREATAP